MNKSKTLDSLPYNTLCSSAAEFDAIAIAPFRLVQSLSSQVIQCIEDGIPVLIENLPEAIDEVLEPVIGKRIVKRGKTARIKVGDVDVEYNSKFR